MQRIKLENLENVVDRINAAGVGTYMVDHTSGGVRLSMLNETGGRRPITPIGTKSETYYRMHAFLDGVEAAQREEQT